MTIHVNGDAIELAGPTTLGEVVDARVTDRSGVAAAVDGVVVPRSAWDGTTLDEGARVEIVGAVQGG